ncbi:MAG: heavy-metal-associated domain-containing protein [candidate division Zixibacteria bacterium]|nr:heavy-metal-associated domain-containing protein [candidate division Zixibacteria bacterium]
MRKVLFVGFVVMAFVAMGAFSAFACESNPACSFSAKTASVKSGCSLSKTTSKLVSSGTTSKSSASLAGGSSCAYKNSTTSAKLASATCSPEQIEACLASVKANHAELCAAAKDCNYTKMSIKGMTCAGCENSIKAALMNLDGVNKVLGVCYKSGYAAVCANPDKASSEVLLKAVSARGFDAEIIPAVAIISTDAKTSTIGYTGKTCGAAKKAATIKTSSAQGTN